MREWIFSFGDRVSVLAPKELQDDRKKQAEHVLRMCRNDSEISEISKECHGT